MTQHHTLSISSAIVAPQADGQRLTPAMTAALWQVAAVLDEQRISPETPDAVWLEIPAKRLRGLNSRPHNTWLRECLRRLTGLELAGQDAQRGEWGAVLLAQWELPPYAETARLLITPAAVAALRGCDTFAKIEATALGQLRGHAARLFVLLADKRRQRQPYWKTEVVNLRKLLGVDTPAYQRWYEFRRSVLAPAIESINEGGLVEVKMTPIRSGRRITTVRLDWRWPDLAAIRARQRQTPDAPPLLAAGQPEWWERAKTWWNVQLTDGERVAYAASYGRAHPNLEEADPSLVIAWNYHIEHPDDPLPAAEDQSPGLQPPTQAAAPPDLDPYNEWLAAVREWWTSLAAGQRQEFLAVHGKTESLEGPAGQQIEFTPRPEDVAVRAYTAEHPDHPPPPRRRLSSAS